MRRLTIMLVLLAAVAGVGLAVGASIASYHVVAARSAEEPLLDAEAQAAAEKAKAEWLRQIDSPFVVRLVITSVEEYGTGNYIFVFDVYRWFGVGRGYAAVARAADGEPIAACGGTLSPRGAIWDDVELARLRQQWAEQYAEAPCTDEEAMAIIRAFVGRPEMVPKLEPELMDKRFPWERHYFEEGSGASFTMDVERRAVLSAMLPRGYAGPGGTLDCDQAQQVATEFAAARVPGFERLTLVGRSLMDEDVGPRCEFLWQELLGTQEAYGMQAVRVSIDGATGSIDLFAQRLPVPITVDVEPKVTREQALAIAEQRFGRNVRASWAQLSLGWRHDDRTQGQVLRWQVVLQSDELVNPALPDMPLRGSYTIDAATGEVLEELG